MEKTVLFRRKRQGRTNYKKRLVLLKGRQPRIVVRKTNKQMIIQIVMYEPDGDKIVTGVASSALRKLGWKYSCANLPACYLAGLMAGKKAAALKVKQAVLDTGLQSNVLGSKIYAAVKGAIDAGLDVPAGEEAFPTQERLVGEHIVKYASTAKEGNQFSAYKKQKVDVSKLKSDFESIKKKILS